MYLSALDLFWLGFLPSSFSMYAVTLSSALLLFGRPCLAVSVAACGVLLGWPFSILAVLPITIHSLTSGKFKEVFLSGAATSIVIVVSVASETGLPKYIQILLQL